MGQDSYEAIHEHLQQSVGSWNAQEAIDVKGSRFFEWMAKWRKLSPYWGFLRVVYDAWHVLKSREAEQAQETELQEQGEQGPEASAAAAETADREGQAEEKRPRGGKLQQVHADLIQELRDKQKSRHTLSVVRDILGDDRVRVFATMIAASQREHVRDYQEMIEALKSEHPQTLAKLNAEEASRRWLVMVARILSILTDEPLLAELGFSVLQDEACEEGAAHAELFFDLVVRSASQRSWTQCTLSELPPHCWCAVVSSDMTDANAALKQMRTDCVVVKAALAAIRATPPHPELQARSLQTVLCAGLEAYHEQFVVPQADNGGRRLDIQPNSVLKANLLSEAVRFLLVLANLLSEAVRFLVVLANLLSEAVRFLLVLANLLSEAVRFLLVLANLLSEAVRFLLVLANLLSEADCWRHMEHFQWDPRAVYTHCLRLASMPISTKESLEDLIGETGDHVSRDAKKQSGAMPERSFFYNCTSSRLQSVPYLRLGPGEFVSEEARDRFLLSCTFCVDGPDVLDAAATEEFHGIPARYSRGSGLLQQCGAPCKLIPYFLGHGMALMKAWFSAETEQQQWERCSRLLQTSHSRKIVQVAGIREAVAELVKAGEADEQQMFKALAASIENEETEELIKARVNQPRATAESSTPECLKKLRPSVENCVLVYQIRAQSFQSYYPKPLSEEQKANPKVKKHFSTSRTFGTKWTKLQALRLVVQFLWTHHRKLKRVAWMSFVWVAQLCRVNRVPELLP
ncbi:HMCN1 [Symbiodinium sp. CCMP2592]|nr:HMCN1 [Symbiodinium sp. CCMP2592]